MARRSGIVKTVRVDQEGQATVLRLVVESRNEDIPVEMRGSEIRGVLEIGDQIVFKGSGKRGRDGVIRPKKLINKTTNSIVEVKSPNIIARFFRFVFSFVFSLISGVLTAGIASIIFPTAQDVITPDSDNGFPYPPSGVEYDANIIPLIIGVVVGLIVFYFTFIKRRRSF